MREVTRSEKPRHKIATNKKTVEGYFKPTMNYYADRANFGSPYYSEMTQLFKAACGDFDMSGLKYVANPTNTQNEQYMRSPARLRNYDIIRPVLDLFMGESGRRPDDVQVVATNSDVVNSQKAAKNQMFAGLLAQDFVNNLNEAGIPTGVPSQPVPSYKDANAEFETSYDDKRAIKGQEALDYLRYNLDFDEKIQQLMFDWLCVGSVRTFKDVYMDDVQYEVCDPRDVFVIGMPASGYVEDAEAVIYRKYMTKSEIIDRFNEQLTKKIPGHPDNITYLDYLDSKQFGGQMQLIAETGYVRDDQMNKFDQRNPVMMDETKAVVEYICWQGMKKVGVLWYNNMITGQVEQSEIDDTYQFDAMAGDIKIDWEWINCWYYGWRIDRDIHLEMGEGIVQRNELNNNATNKLPFNGRDRGYRTNEIMSIVKTGLPYQELYNALHFRFEFMLAKSKNKITAFPVGLIPTKKGWDEDKWFYWAMVHDIMMYDESMPNASVAIQGIKQLDMALGNYILDMWRLLGEVRLEWWDSVGMNRQRFGDTYASDGKGNVEQAIFRSALISDEMFRSLNKLLEKDYAGLLDYSKVAWINGKKGAYITSSGTRAFFEIEGSDFLETDFGIFCKNTKEEADKLERAKSLLQTMGQNGMKPDTMLEVLDATSVSKIKHLAKQALKIERELDDAQAERNRQSAEYIQQMKSEDAKMKSEDTRYVADTAAMADKEVALINAKVNLAEFYADTINKNRELMETLGVDTISRVDDRYAEIKADLDNRSLLLQRDKLNVDMMKTANSLKVARENRNKYDRKN